MEGEQLGLAEAGGRLARTWGRRRRMEDTRRVTPATVSHGRHFENMELDSVLTKPTDSVFSR
jgi:hypothetical protein